MNLKLAKVSVEDLALFFTIATIKHVAMRIKVHYGTVYSIWRKQVVWSDFPDTKGLVIKRNEGIQHIHQNTIWNEKV